jgi:hypothetical protein
MISVLNTSSMIKKLIASLNMWHTNISIMRIIPMISEEIHGEDLIY